jgi:hypothetical protein
LIIGGEPNEAQEGSDPASGIMTTVSSAVKVPDREVNFQRGRMSSSIPWPSRSLTEADDLKPALVAKVMPHLDLELDHLELPPTPPTGRTIAREGPKALALWRGREHFQIQGRGRIPVGYYSG